MDARILTGAHQPTSQPTLPSPRVRMLVTLGNVMISRAGEARAVAERFLDAIVRGFLEEDVVTTLVREFPTCWRIDQQFGSGFLPER